MKTSAITIVAAARTAAAFRNVIYYDQYHTTTLPPRTVTAGTNYVITAFATSTIFNSGSSYVPFINPTAVREIFDPGTKVCMAIGGWGDTAGFSTAAASEDSRKLYAKNIANALNNLGYDCVDVDWEYPGGDGQDYKQIPNSCKASEIETYPLLLQEIKAAIGKKELSIAVPGKEKDMIAFTAEQVPKINKIVDFVNVMAYDLMNRRDNVTNHFSSVVSSLATIDTYLARGMSADKMNLGFAMYAKYFTTQGPCEKPTGCPTVALEDAEGQDTNLSGAVTFEEMAYNGGTGGGVTASFVKAMSNGKPDTEAGGQWYWDDATKLYWTWDTPEFIGRKFTDIVKARKLGGVMSWSLAEDSHDWSHLKAIQQGVKGM